jgi:hypothetical protein
MKEVTTRQPVRPDLTATTLKVLSFRLTAIVPPHARYTSAESVRCIVLTQEIWNPRSEVQHPSENCPFQHFKLIGRQLSIISQQPAPAGDQGD